MKFYSTNNKNNLVSFKEAVIKGIADDGGLFLPVEIRKQPLWFIDSINNYSFAEIAYSVSKILLEDEIPDRDLKKIIDESINFDVPLIKLQNDSISVLELFHGPTLAFKDFGARFMAKTLSYFNQNENEITILVATSGDTGSAVANGFLNVEGIKVILLYPSGKVSLIQEKQLTTLNGNITALEIEGTFDDCQRLVKQAFADRKLKKELILSSANSINIARLIPQSFYYFFAYSQIENKNKSLVFSVPSGNFGNLTGGILAMMIGLPVHKFIAALNINDVFLDYIKKGVFEPRKSIRTISNAMDVGNPSNFFRIKSLFNESYKEIKERIHAASFSDEQTRAAIKEVFSKFNYIMDPHGAVGYLALKEFTKGKKAKSINGVILETAHPAKFIDDVEDILKMKIEVPERLQRSLEQEKKSIRLSSSFEEFKSFLLKKS
jgi:threonine synthase